VRWSAHHNGYRFRSEDSPLSPILALPGKWLADSKSQAEQVDNAGIPAGVKGRSDFIGVILLSLASGENLDVGG
jgi:hypothetical protein